MRRIPHGQTIGPVCPPYLAGGKPSTYVIQYRIMPDGAWAIADTTPDTKITIAGQPEGKTLEYHVFARNKAGDGLVSNVVEVVL